MNVFISPTLSFLRHLAILGPYCRQAQCWCRRIVDRGETGLSSLYYLSYLSSPAMSSGFYSSRSCFFSIFFFVLFYIICGSSQASSNWKVFFFNLDWSFVFRIIFESDNCKFFVVSRYLVCASKLPCFHNVPPQGVLFCLY